MIYSSEEKERESHKSVDLLSSSQAFKSFKSKKDMTPSMQRALFGKYVKVKATSTQNAQTGIDHFTFSVPIGTLPTKEFSMHSNIQSDLISSRSLSPSLKKKLVSKTTSNKNKIEVKTGCLPKVAGRSESVSKYLPLHISKGEGRS